MKPLSPAFILLLMLAAVPAAAGHLPYNMETISVTDGLCSNNVYAVVQDQVGYMWFGTDNGLDRYDGKTLKHYVHDSENNFSLTSSTINCLIYSDCFGLLAGTENGICRYVPEKDMFASWFSEVTGGENVRTFFEEPDSTLWIGTNNGLYRVDAAGDEIINYNMSNSGVSHNIVRAIYADDRYVFVATFDGVSRMEKSTGKWINLNLKKYYIKLPQNNLVLSILQSPWDMDVLYIGMQTGFCVLDKNTMEYSVHDMSSDRNMCNNTVKTICQVKDELWLGTEEGVMIYRDGGFSSFGYDPDNLHSLPNNIVWQVYKDRNDIVWLATEGGVAHYDAGMPNFDKYDLTESTGNPYVGISFFAAASDWSGRIWLGSRFGLASYSRESNTTRWVELSTAVPGTYNFVRGLYVDRNDILWVGTAEGVLCYDTRLDREVSIQPHLKNRLKYINVMKNLDDNGILVCDVFGRVQIIRYGFDSRNRKIVAGKCFDIHIKHHSGEWRVRISTVKTVQLIHDLFKNIMLGIDQIADDKVRRSFPYRIAHFKRQPGADVVLFQLHKQIAEHGLVTSVGKKFSIVSYVHFVNSQHCQAFGQDIGHSGKEIQGFSVDKRSRGRVFRHLRTELRRA